MIMLLFLSLFMTIFLSLYLVSIKLNPDFSVKDLLKNSNQRIKLWLVRKKKPTKKRTQLRQKLNAAGVLLKPEEFMAFQWIAAIIAAGILHLISQAFVLMVPGFLIGYMMPVFWLKRNYKKRLKQFNNGLPGMMTSMIGSLRAGFSFVQSLQLVAEESYSPMKEEVEFVLRSMQYGASIEEALVEWKERMPSEDLELLVEAILIQRQAGGNLAYLLDKIVETARERTKLENQIKTLTAQGRLSGIIISALPLILGIMIYVINPEYIMTLFTNPIGMFMLGGALIGGIIGFLLVRKITTIEV